MSGTAPSGDPHDKADSVEAKPSTFASLAVPGYRVLWWSGLFSFMGVQMQFLLRGLLAWDLTEREGALGLVYLVFGLSMLVATPLGGVAADRLPKRRLLFVGQFVITLAAIGMGVAVLAGVEQFWMLMLASVSQGSMFGLIGPARVSFSRELVGPELLGNAITLSVLSMSSTRIFAPSLAGALAGVAAFGIGGAYLVAAAFSLLSAALTFLLPDTAIGEPTGRNPFQDIADGVRYVAARPSLRRLVLTSTVVIMFGFNYVAFMPALVEGLFELGEGSVGLMSTASSIGAVAVSIPLASRADSPGARRMIVVFGFGFGVTVGLLGVAPVYWLALVVVVGIGAAATGFQSLSSAVALADADMSHQGRVQSLMQLSFAGFGIAAAPLGALAEWIGLRNTMRAMGLVPVVAIGLYAAGEGFIGGRRGAVSPGGA
jgi:MFS family permease